MITTSSDFSEILKIACPNEEIKSILHGLFYNVLNVEFNLFGWARTMCKYGDLYLYLDIDEKLGITNVIGLPTVEVERMEGEDKANPNYVQYQWNSGGVTFENWQLAHFRVLGNDKFAPYGSSVLEPSRRIWRQLVLIEDAMMSYRIVRSPERRVFYIDVGNIEPNDVEAYIERIKTNLRRNQVIDPETGRVDLRYNPMSIEEDYFIPIRGDKSSRIESLPGGTYTGDIDDVNYLRDKLFSALKIPKSYLAQGDAMEDKTTLAQKDIHFARTVLRLQRAVISELYKIAIVHLYTLGYRDDDLTGFTMHLNNPSRISELQELEYMRTKFDLVNGVPQGFYSRRWVSKNVLNMTDDEILQNRFEMYSDMKFDANLEAAAAESAAEAQMGMMGGEGGMPGMPGMPGMEGGMPGMPGMEGGGPEAALAGMLGGGGPPPEGEAPPAEGEETMLLAQPGDEGEAAGEGGEGTEAAAGKRDMRPQGAKERSMATLVNPYKDPRSGGKRPYGSGELGTFARNPFTPLVAHKELDADLSDEKLILEVSSRTEELIKDVEEEKIREFRRIANEKISEHARKSRKE